MQQTQTAYNNAASKFAESRSGKMMWEEVDMFLPYLPKQQPLHILDLGCGSGRLLPYLATHCTIASYRGIDFSTKLLEEALEWNKGLIDAQPFPITFQEGLLQSFEISYPADVIFALASLHHLPSKALQLQCLQNIYASLSKGGILCMMNWNLLEIPKYAQYRVSEESQDFLIPLHSGISHLERYYYGFQPEELENLLQRAGFTLLKQWMSKGTIEQPGWNICTVGQKK